MRYWDDMQTKWGFNDGDAVPDGIEVFRSTYIQVINVYAERLGSKYHCEAWDRAGLHNWCFVVVVRNEGESVDEAVMRPDEMDGAMVAAIQQAQEDGLDQFINVVVTVDHDGVDALCWKIKKTPVEELTP